jgi:transporter family-2 protein
MSRLVGILCTLAAGGVVALQPPANAALARHVSDLGAAFISAVITVSLLAAALLIAGQPARLSGLSGFRPGYALGGIGGATVVAVSLIAVRTLGAGVLTALLVAAQLGVSLLADRLGWFGLHQVGLTAGRWAGVALVVAGTVLITRG